MAVLTKKLNIQKTGSSAVACNIYSTTTEAGSTYFPVTVDGVSGTHYVALGSTSDANATVGRVMKGSTTYAIKSQSKPPYTEVSYTTAGTHTFTVPSGITRVRVACCGGGGGGASAADRYGEIGEYTSAKGGDGGASSFASLVTAGGGGGGYASVCAYTIVYDPEDGAEKEVAYAGYEGKAGTPNGHVGKLIYNYGTNYPNNRYGRNVSFTDTASESSISYGSGGGATHRDKDDYWQQASTGGSGGYVSTYITVTPNTAYSITVGAGGASSLANPWGTAKAGVNGFVLIAYGGDI